MSYIRLHSSVFKSFMPKGEGSLFVDITVRLPVKFQLLRRMTKTEGNRAVALKVWFQTSTMTCEL